MDLSVKTEVVNVKQNAVQMTTARYFEKNVERYTEVTSFIVKEW